MAKIERSKADDEERKRRQERERRRAEFDRKRKLDIASLERLSHLCWHSGFTSLVFVISGMYLIFNNSLPFGLGVPLVIILSLMFVVFARTAIQAEREIRSLAGFSIG